MTDAGLQEAFARLETIEVCQRLLFRYQALADTGRRSELATLFTADVHFVVTFDDRQLAGCDIRGRRELHAFFTRPRPNTPSFERHYATNVSVEITAEGAELGASFIHVQHDGRRRIIQGGEYRWQFRHEVETWWVSVALAHVSWRSPLAVPDQD